MKDGIPTTVISDNMAGAMMSQGKIGAIVVGADRIAANGDVANKIGTYTVAILAKNTAFRFMWLRRFLPWISIAPMAARFHRAAQRARSHAYRRQADGAGRRGVENPAFDVTPAKYVAAIITEKGIARTPYGESLAKLEGKASAVEV